jgi:hypothetical protein
MICKYGSTVVVCTLTEGHSPVLTFVPLFMLLISCVCFQSFVEDKLVRRMTLI